MVLKIEVGSVIEENCYVYFSEKISSDGFHHGFLIDPGDESEKILRELESQKICIEKILITHGHHDHIGALKDLQPILKCSIMMSKSGKIYSEDPIWNLSQFFGNPIRFDELPIEFLENHSKITTTDQNLSLELIETPGHTLDGAIYYSSKDNLAFVGDTIFKNSFGRTDFPGGNMNELMKSIREIILKLPNETILYPGHMDSTTVQDEKKIYP